MKTLSDPTKQQQRAFALIVTVILLSLLAIMAVAFLSTSRVERGTASAVTNKAKADLIAQTATNAAIAALTDNLNTYPDSATTWESINGNDGTVLYYRDKTPEQAIAAGTAAQLYVLPLTSGGTAQTVANKANALPVLADSPAPTANAYNLNRSRFSGDTQGWIGAAPLPAPASTPPPLRGQWINLTDSDSKITGRYAYWMEDESFKANANLMGNTLRGISTLGNDPTQIPLQGVLQSILTSGSDYDNIAKDIFNYRQKFPSSLFFEYRALNQVAKNASTFDFSKLADNAKFEATIYSGTSNLSRSGSKRVNLNKVVADSTDATAIRTQLDEIIKTITYHLPNFGERFYRTSTVSSSNYTTVLNDATEVQNTNSAHRTIYLNKIAANIRDYIDTDSQPTIVKNDPPNYSVIIGSIPKNAIPGGGASGANEVIAIGKENVPFLQEYLLRVKEDTFSARLGTSASYKVEIDHYLEFWNMTNKDISVTDLGPNAFLRIANQFRWNATGATPGTDIPDSPTRDFSVPLSAFHDANGNALVFRAGIPTVLTTDPTPLPGAFGIDSSRLFRPTAGVPADQYRVYQGVTTYKSSSNLRITAQTRPTLNGYDYETELILGNDNGIIESFGAPAVNVISVNVDDAPSASGQESAKLWTSSNNNTCAYHFRGSSLKGNATGFTPIPSQKGDPRTNNEQLSLSSGSSVGDDQTSYKNELNSTNMPNYVTLTAPNSQFVDCTTWPDPSSNSSNQANAPTVAGNAQLSSIGQLGNIFDPVRAIGTGSGDISYSRGGGRTFKIGQPERYDSNTNTAGLWDGNSNSKSREWTSWRLADIFSSTDSVQLDGRINVNGINRDNGIALKAALYGYTFQATPDSDPSLSGNNFDADPNNSGDKVNELYNELKARLTNDQSAYGGAFANTVGPLAERGELSEMPMFNNGTNLVASVDTKNVNDRGREELFRRLVELITTRGNIFTVYAAGQSLVPSQSGGNPVVTSTTQLKVTFRIDPVWNSGTPSDPFDPTISTRFNKPDTYAIKILYAGD